jgi:hypothetical protein
LTVGELERTRRELAASLAWHRSACPPTPIKALMAAIDAELSARDTASPERHLLLLGRSYG